MSDTPTLDDLLRQLAHGDRSVFKAVFERLWPPTLKLCQRLSQTEADAADAAQAAMMRILERAHQYDAKRPALPWALAIASWECRTLTTRRARRAESAEAAPDSDAGAQADAQEQRLMVSAALEAMGTLSEADQETLVATYWDTVAGASGATLRKRRERALARLRKAFAQMYGLD